jgi:hypothetical protein
VTPHERLRRKVVAVARALDDCGIPYAVGGALAFGYWAEPRGTLDIDIDVFMSVTNSRPALECLKRLGAAVDVDAAAHEVERRDQVRLLLDDTAVDLFFAYNEFHDSCQGRAQRMPFEEITMPVLSAEDIVIFKAMFNRPKDWLDIEQVILTQRAGFDAAYALGWLDRMVGPDDSSRRRLAAIIEQTTSA